MSQTPHPLEKVLAKMPQRDRDIANKLMEKCGENNESLYAALPNPAADKFLSRNYRTPKKEAKS